MLCRCCILPRWSLLHRERCKLRPPYFLCVRVYPCRSAGKIRFASCSQLGTVHTKWQSLGSFTYMNPAVSRKLTCGVREPLHRKSAFAQTVREHNARRALRRLIFASSFPALFENNSVFSLTCGTDDEYEEWNEIVLRRAPRMHLILMPLHSRCVAHNLHM